MLFNSVEFLLVFLPVVLTGFFLIAKTNHFAAAAWLVLASLFFYGWWNPTYLLLLAASIVFNFCSGYALARIRKRWLLTLCVSTNLILLAYYKYTNFLVGVITDVVGGTASPFTLILPLGISFFTFTQIAFLVDVYRGYVKEYSFIHYALFVTYFPHLIAGPILHHKEMMPQFQHPTNYRLSWTHIAVGSTIFSIGLFKKTVLADGIAPYATPLFTAPEAPDLFAAWGGALAYTLQLYFDFSGYSDMAIGLSRLFGVRLPLNFDSPYKATSIIDFWRRWHMTLSRFLRDYLYVPLGGNRKGPYRRYLHLLITMLLGGLWHGAGWTFLVWGLLHGVYLVVNHGWRALRDQFKGRSNGSILWRAVGQLITFGAVVVAWVFFRANSVPDAIEIIKGMAGLYGVSIPAAIGHSLGPIGMSLNNLGVNFALGGGWVFVQQIAWIAVLLPLCFWAPNTQEITARFAPAIEAVSAAKAPQALSWEISLRWAWFIGLITSVGLLSMSRVSEFLYYQF